MDNEHISLNKYISSTGFCSRREADKLIEQARVTINDELVASNLRVYPGDVVEVDGEPIKKKSKERPIYIAFNKPVGVTSTTDVKDRSNIIYFMGYPKRIFPIGRLDKDSDGLIFLTNDGDIVNKILRASNFHEKEYVVIVDKAITPDFIRQMSSGVPVLGEMTRKCFVRQEGGRRFRIILTQGLNRQIRRMCDYLGYSVQELRRVRIMNIELGSLPVGKWRYFTGAEIDKLNEMVAESSKVDAMSGKAKGKSKAKTEERVAVQYIPKRKPKTNGAEAAPGKPKEKGKFKDKPAGIHKPKGKPSPEKQETKSSSKTPKTSGKYASFRSKRSKN